MSKVADVYTLYTDKDTKFGHEYFVMTNDFAQDVADQFSIPDGVAQSLKISANAYIKRTGGYPNPAADDEDEDGAVTLIKSCTLLSAFSSLALLAAF